MADRYWVGGAGNWNDTAKWSATSGGATGASVPVAADAVIFDGNSDVGGADFTVSFPTGVGAVCTTITFASTTTNVATFDFLSSTGTLTVSGALTVAGTGTGAGILFANTGASSVSVGSIVHTNSTFGFSGTSTITSATYAAASNTVARILQMGTSGLIKITQIGQTTPWNIVVGSGGHTNNGTGTVEFTGAMVSGNIRTVTHAGSNPENVSFKISGGASGSSTSFTSGSTIGSLEFTSGYAGSWTNTTLSIAGSLTLSSTMNINSTSGVVTFTGNTTNTIITAGKTCDFQIFINKGTGTISLGGALTIGATRTLTLSTGTFDANNYNISVGLFSSSNTNTRTILMGTGIWTLASNNTGTVWDLATTTNLTFTKSTANIVLSSGVSNVNRTFAGGGLTYNTLTIGGISPNNCTTTITGSNTFDTFATTRTRSQSILFQAGSTTSIGVWSISGSVSLGAIITLGVSGSGTFTLYLIPDTPTDRFLLENMSISNGNATPASTWYVGTTSTDGGNNTGFIFGNFLYWRGGTGTWTDVATTNWSTTSGGSSSGIAPTNTTDVYFNTSSDAGIAFTVTIGSGAICNSITVGAQQYNMTLAGTSNINISGSMTLPATLFTRTYTGDITFTSASANTITTSGISLASNITFSGTGSWTLGSAFTTGATNVTTMIGGTLDANGYNFTTGTFNSSFTNTRSILMGTGTWTLSGTFSVWNLSDTTNLTFTKSTANIVLSSTSTADPRTFAGGGLTYNNLTVGGSGGAGSVLTITGSNTFATFASTKAVAHTILFTAGTTTTITSWTVSGTAGNVVTLGVSGTGTFTLTKTTSTVFQVNYLSVSNGNANPDSTWYVGGNSTDGGNNTGFIFKSFLYWRGGTGSWTSTATTNWSTTSGGASSGIAPTINTDVYFDANSDASAIFTVTVSTGATCNNIVVSGLQFTMTLAGTAAWSIGGSMTLPATLFTRTYTGAITFTSAAANTITTSGITLASNITFSGTGSWTLGTALTTGSTNSTTLTSGTLSLSSYTYTTGIFASSNTNTRTIAFGTGKVVLNRTTSGVTLWDTSDTTSLTTTGTPLVETINGNTGVSRFINPGTPSEANSISFTLSDLSSNSFISFTFGSVIKNLYVNNGGIINGALTIYGSVTTRINAGSGTGAWTFKGSGTKTLAGEGFQGNVWDFPIIFDEVGGVWQLTTPLIVKTITLVGGTFNASSSSIDVGNFISNGTSVRSILMGTNTWTLTGEGTVWDLATTTNLTFTKSTANIVLSDTSTTARTFAGGGLTYNNLTIGGPTGTSTLTLTGSNTFNTFASTKTVAHTILFTGGTTTTFTSFTVTGTAGNVVTIGSTDTTQATIAKPTAWYVGGNSINGGNNTNLLFGGGNNLDYLNLSYINGSPEVPPSASFFMFCT